MPRHASCSAPRREHSRNHVSEGGLTMNVTTRNSREPALVGNTLEHRIGRLFGDVSGDLDWQYRDSAGASWVPPVYLLEDPDASLIMAEVPGVTPDNGTMALETG